jgi:hypothetical protein
VVEEVADPKKIAKEVRWCVGCLFVGICLLAWLKGWVPFVVLVVGGGSD